MRTTAKLALPYPELSDPPNVPADVQRLAEKLDVVIPALTSGYWNALTEITAANSNWEMSWFQAAKSYYLVTMTVGFYYRGTATLKGGSDGNIADTHIGTLNRILLRPMISVSGTLTTADTLCHVIVASDGKIWLRGFANTLQTIAKNEGCNLAVSYPTTRT